MKLILNLYFIVFKCVWLLLNLNCLFASEVVNKSPIKVLLYQAPNSIHPLSAFDYVSSIMSDIIFDGLINFDADLNPIAALSYSWDNSADFRKWFFKLNTNKKYQSGELVKSDDILNCFLNYKKNASYKETLKSIKSIFLLNNILIFQLSDPNPDFLNFISSIKFFKNKKGSICTSEKGPISGTGTLSTQLGWIEDFSPKSEILLYNYENKEMPPLHFIFISEENTRALFLIGKKADVAINTFNNTKFDWLKNNTALSSLTRDGINLSYLAFNHQNKILSSKEVRKALAYAFPKKSITTQKYKTYLTPAHGFLNPSIKESYSEHLDENLSTAESILEQEGYKKDKKGIRLTLEFQTTQQKDGLDPALIFKEQLKKIGVDLKVQIVELAVFYSRLLTGNFQLYASRMIGVKSVADLEKYISSRGKINRIGYKNIKIDNLYEQLHKELNSKKRAFNYKEIQKTALNDFAYFPLWYWNNAILLNPNLTGVTQSDLSLSGGIRSLTQLRWKK